MHKEDKSKKHSLEDCVEGIGREIKNEIKDLEQSLENGLKKTEIIYFGEKAVVACDMKCNKAWGIIGRPHIYLQDPKKEIYGLGYKNGMLWMDDENFDENDVVHLSDDELGDAPNETGTWEGGHGKPCVEDFKNFKHNRWCVRACERCGITERGNPDGEIKITDWSKRVYNIPTSDPDCKENE